MHHNQIRGDNYSFRFIQVFGAFFNFPLWVFKGDAANFIVEKLEIAVIEGIPVISGLKLDIFGTETIPNLEKLQSVLKDFTDSLSLKQLQKWLDSEKYETFLGIAMNARQSGLSEIHDSVKKKIDELYPEGEP